jgi:predicted enzyme related to lactoylglutathione lyase
MSGVAFNLVVIRSADLEKAASFYAGIGLALVRERHGSGPEHLAAELGGVVFEVYPLGDSTGTRAVRIGFRVSSIASVLAIVQSLGGEVVSPARESPWGIRAVISDPDGHRVELNEATEEAEPGVGADSR